MEEIQGRDNLSMEQQKIKLCGNQNPNHESLIALMEKHLFLFYPTLTGKHRYFKREEYNRRSGPVISKISVPVDSAILNAEYLEFNHHKDLCLFPRSNALQWLHKGQSIKMFTLIKT